MLTSVLQHPLKLQTLTVHFRSYTNSAEYHKDFFPVVRVDFVSNQYMFSENEVVGLVNVSINIPVARDLAVGLFGGIDVHNAGCMQ